MTLPIDMTRMTPQQRAATLLSAARSDLSGRLWSAALGSTTARSSSPVGTLPGDAATSSGTSPLPRTALDSLLDRLLAAEGALAPPAAEATGAVAPPPETASSESAPLSGLGANTRYADTLQAAATRVGIPAPALAAIIDAEAARNRDGSWNPLSRNSRSSAAGLGQFLSGTWLDMARTPGTWLNAQAKARGLVDSAGHIAQSARADLLAMRYDPAASIQAIADYAHGNIARLRKSGIAIGDQAQDVAQAAYIGHHLGPGDALRFYRGTISPTRARVLLTAQIGSTRAAQKIAATGNAAGAHRTWLLGHIARHIDTGRYAAPVTFAATAVNEKNIG